MSNERAARPIPLAMTVLVAFFAGLVALAVSNGHDAMAHGNVPAHAEAAFATSHSPVAITRKGSALRTDLRML